MSKVKNDKQPVAKNILQLRNFGMRFDENVLFTHMDLDLEPGIYAFSGPSGCGKSTLMRCIAGLENRYTGEIFLNGEKQVWCSQDKHMMMQHYTSFPWLNVLENALMVYKGHQITPTAEDIKEAKEILKKLGLEEHLDKLPSQISGGQDQRLSLASAIMNRWSKVFLYDEPTSALDNDNDMIVVEMIKEHQKKYGTIEIIITHEEHVIEGLGAKILEFTPEFRLHPPKVEEVPVHEDDYVENVSAEDVNVPQLENLLPEVTAEVPITEEGVAENAEKIEVTDS